MKECFRYFQSLFLVLHLLKEEREKDRKEREKEERENTKKAERGENYAERMLKRI